jgi:hypothetical protein
MLIKRFLSSHASVYNFKNFAGFYFLDPVDRGRKKRGGKEGRTHPVFFNAPQFDEYMYGFMSDMLKVNIRYAAQQVGITATAVSVQCVATFFVSYDVLSNRFR